MFKGIILGAAAFLAIGICHPIVIKLEYHLGRQAWWVLLGAGLIFSTLSIVFSGNSMISAILGVLAFSALWGIYEMFKQEKRVLAGWFPENPKRKEHYARKRAELGM